jgi:hypothetical protein
MEIQLGPEKEDKKRSEDRKDNPGRMKRSPWFWPRKQMRNQPADERADDAQSDRPKQRQMDVHDRLRDVAGNEADNYVPDEMKHGFSVLSLAAVKVFTLSGGRDFYRGRVLG